MDLFVLGALVIGRPDLQPLWEKPRQTLSRAFVPLGTAGAGVAGLLALLAGGAHFQFGSTEAALAAMRGERLSIRPSVVNVGAGAPGQVLSATVELVNRADHAIRLYGGTSDCSCVATDDLPLTIPPGQARSLGVKIKLPAAVGMFTRYAVLLTDDEGARRVSFRLTGRITKPNDSTVAEGK